MGLDLPIQQLPYRSSCESFSDDQANGEPKARVDDWTAFLHVQTGSQESLQGDVVVIVNGHIFWCESGQVSGCVLKNVVFAGEEQDASCCTDYRRTVVERSKRKRTRASTTGESSFVVFDPFVLSMVCAVSRLCLHILLWTPPPSKSKSVSHQAVCYSQWIVQTATVGLSICGLLTCPVPIRLAWHDVPEHSGFRQCCADNIFCDQFSSSLFRCSEWWIFCFSASETKNIRSGGTGILQTEETEGIWGQHQEEQECNHKLVEIRWLGREPAGNSKVAVIFQLCCSSGCCLAS